MGNILTVGSEFELTEIEEGPMEGKREGNFHSIRSAYL
jgi:hypothetical protein